MKDESPSDPSSCCVRAINLDAWQFLKLPNLAEPDGIGTLDIAECFRLKEKLWHKARLLSDAHRLARLGHWEYLVDDGRMIWSLEIAELLGFQAEDRMPSPSQRAGMHTVESWKRFDAALERTITTGAPFQLDVEVRRRNGEHCWLMVQAEAERDDAEPQQPAERELHPRQRRGGNPDRVAHDDANQDKIEPLAHRAQLALGAAPGGLLYESCCTHSRNCSPRSSKSVN